MKGSIKLREKHWMFSDNIRKTPKAQTIRQKIYRFGYINNKDFCLTKGTRDNVNRWITGWEKTFAFLKATQN